MRKKRQGFTLIELLIVIVIIGILAAIAIPKFTKTREKAFVKAMTSDLRNLATQQELYFATPANNYVNGATGSMITTYLNPSQGVTIGIGVAAATGWNATATHSGIPGVTCSIFFGSAAAITPAVTPGVVACNDNT